MCSRLIFPALTRIPVTVTGAWETRRPHCWSGVAGAEEPVLGVGFLIEGDCACWTKSERREPAFGISLCLFPYESDGRRVQVNLVAGKGYLRGATTLIDGQWRPEMPARIETVTGSVWRLCRVEGEPDIDAAILFVAGRDTSGLRRGLWRVREALANGMPEPYRRMLTYGRTGVLRLEKAGKRTAQETDSHA